MLRRLGIAALVALVGAALLVFGLKRFGAGATGSANEDAGVPKSGQTATASDQRTPVRNGSIAGRVTDEQGNALGDAMVCAEASSVKLVTADMKEPRCERTNKQGEYTIKDLFAAHYTVDANAITFQPGRFRDAQHDSGFTLAAGEARTGVDFVLAHGGAEVRGTVKDISGGVVHGALVRVVAGDFWRPAGSAIATSDAKGEFSVWLPPGPVTATATASGYNKGEKTGIAPGQHIEILLTPESVLQGRVVEAGTDNPVVGARVLSGPVRVNTFGNGTQSTSTLTDADGRFRIANLEPGRYQPTASSDGRWGTTSESVLLGLAETSRDLVIEMRVSPSLIGRIEFDEKKPCPSGSVSLKAKGSQRPEWHGADADGRVRIEGLGAGTYSVSVYCDKAASEDKYPPVVIADKDVTTTWKVNAGLAVKGIVVDGKGAPVSSADIQAETRGGDPRQALGWAGAHTGTDGTFEIRGLRPGSYGLTVHREGAVPLADPFIVEAQHDVSGVRIELPAGGGIDGTIVDDKGAPVTGVEINAKGDRSEWGQGRTTAKDDGTFAFPALRPGTYHVQAEVRYTAVRAPGTKDDDQQGVLATVKVGEAAHVKLVVESQSEHIDGSVVDDSGNAVSDAFVEAERESDSAGAAAGEARRNMQWSWGTVRSPVLTDTDGHFTVDKLAPGSYTVRAFRKGGGETVAEGVKVGTTTTLTIKKEGSIAGTVSDAKGPSDRFSISLRDEKTGVARRESFVHTAGVWTIRDLPAGDFIVAAEAVGRAQTTVSIAQGEAKNGVQLTLAPNASVRGTVISLETTAPIPGMMVFSNAKGAEMGFMIADDGDRKFMTDADGKFEIADAPSGRVQLFALSKDGFGNGEYGFAMVPATLPPGATVDLPPIKVAKLRIHGELQGDLGIGVQHPDPGTDMSDMKLIVSSVRPGSAAARAAVAVGDEIITVDGYDVTAPSTYLADTLLSVPTGTTVKVGLRRGATVSLTAQPPTAK